jgi:5-methylcytosine-specific restriction endonuclease McrA
MVAATEPHHIVKLRDVPARKYDETNLVALCHGCHAAKTARGY